MGRRPCPTSRMRRSPPALDSRRSGSSRPTTSPSVGPRLGADRPAVLDVRCDPNVPPIPPHSTFAQMKDEAQAVLHGDENRWGVVKEGMRTKLQEVLPSRND